MRHTTGQYESGLQGEALAEQYLANQGMTCVARRYRAGTGELDLIMKDEDYLVFVEVKLRPRGRKGAGLYAVTPDKQRRMIHAASLFLMEHALTDSPVRFDVIEITSEGILHIPNAFGI